MREQYFIMRHEPESDGLLFDSLLAVFDSPLLAKLTCRLLNFGNDDKRYYYATATAAESGGRTTKAALMDLLRNGL